MAERDDAYWEGMSRAVERGEYEVVGPLELGPAAAPLRLTRITIYTPPPAVLRHAAVAYAAVLGVEPTSGEDERGPYTEVTDAVGFTIELRPVEPGEGAPTVTRMELRGPGAKAAAERLHEQTGGVQRYLYGGRWDTIAGNSVRLIGPGEDVSAEERERIREAIQRDGLDQEIKRMNEEKR